MDRFTETDQKNINEINEINEINSDEHELCGQVNRVCSPECFFEMIEQCKICGRCV